LRSGITVVAGDIIIDDRLFQSFNFRGQFNVRPIFVNDDVVDASIQPTRVGRRASVTIRPRSAALHIKNRLQTSEAGSEYTLELDPELPQCIGQRGCSAAITGALPSDFVPPLTAKFPLVQTFRIVEPSNYARTVFIEALEAAGITVNADPVAPNRVDLLPRDQSNPRDKPIAELMGLPYSDDAKLILKVSYNIGADTSLVLFGLTQGVDNINNALAVERKVLGSRYGIPDDQFQFFDGSGGGDTTASSRAIIQMLVELSRRPAFQAFFDALPILAEDGSLAFTTDFQSDPTLAGDRSGARENRNLSCPGRQRASAQRTGFRGLYHHQTWETPGV
jgi:D-alanyl-D-alanine carboxypeptidase